MADSKRKNLNIMTPPPEDPDLHLSPTPKSPPTSFRLASNAGTSWLSFEEVPDEDTLQFLLVATGYIKRPLTKPALTRLLSYLQQYSQSAPLISTPFIGTGVPTVRKTNYHQPSTSNPTSRTQPDINISTPLFCGLSLGVPIKEFKGITNQAHQIGQQLPTFRYFPNLPPELQLLIWTFAVPGPRLVSSRDLSKLKVNHKGQAWVHTECVSNIQIPALLHTCHTSRTILSKTYKLSFSDNLRHPIYFDVQRDTMMMETLGALHEFSRMSSRHPEYHACTIRFLAIRFEAFQGSNKRKIESAINECVRRLGNLKELVIVLPDGAPENFPWGLLKAAVDRALVKMIEYRRDTCLVQGHDKQRCVGWKVPEILFLTEGDLLKRRGAKVIL